MSAGLSASAVTAAYKISDGVQETTKKLGEEHPEIAREVISDTLAPFRYILYVLALLLAGPFVVGRIKRCIAEAKKKPAATPTASGREDSAESRRDRKPDAARTPTPQP